MALFDFAQIRKTIADLGAEIKKLRGEREEFLRRREDLESDLRCKSDVVDLLDAYVDRKGADFPRRLETGLNFYRRHALEALPEDPKAPTHPMAVLTATLDPNAAATIGALESALCYVMPDEVKRGLRRAVEDWDFSAAGPSRTERIAEIEEIDKRIDELDKQERELVEQAEKVGLRL